MLTMICTKKGYAILDAQGKILTEFSIKRGQRLYRAQHEVGIPEVRSIYLRGAIDALTLPKLGRCD